ncbi:AbrB/MazE/SpoVT family DNA-binding domain-containing protein [archaeon]
MDVVRLSSKGQLVIPQEMRADLELKAGEKLVIIGGKDGLVLKPLKRLSGELLQELADAKLAADSWKEMDKGKALKFSKNRFRKELESW